MFTYTLSGALSKFNWQDTPNKIRFPFIIYIRTLINYEWQLISGVQGPSLSAVSKSTKCTVCHGVWTLTKNLPQLYRFGCLFAGENSLIIWEKCVQCVCECTCPHVFDNNKASENEEELNCVSHFSFPCFSACQKKALHFEWWLRQQKVNNKPCGSEERWRRKKKERKCANIYDKYKKWPSKQTKQNPNINALIIPLNMPWKWNVIEKKKLPIQLALIQFWKDLSRGWFNVRASIL